VRTLLPWLLLLALPLLAACGADDYVGFARVNETP
jgi:hypothetical protein